MTYLDNAATTYPKPQQVRAAVQNALVAYGANPGRAGHALSLAAAEEVYRCRAAAADFFAAPGPECVAFTLNCTHALNCVLKGLLKPGDHVVASCLEHNAVMRPLYALEQEKGVSYTLAQVVPGDNDATVEAFRAAMRPNTKLVVCTHISNVWGVRLPVERIAALAHQYDAAFCLDAAQSAGVLPVRLTDGYDYVCVAAHKGLYAPMGIGLLITAAGEGLSTLIEGGTGTESASLAQPLSMPERMESGTLNVPGISGLRAGIAFVNARGTERILAHELRFTQRLYSRLAGARGINLYAPRPVPPYFGPVLSFNAQGFESEELGMSLSKAGFAVRAGLHCAPEAHRFYGTLEQGAVRVCPSVFSNINETEAFYLALMKIISQRR